MSVSAAASTGDRMQALVAMRDKLAVDMDDAPPTVVAQIAGRLSAILVEIDELGGAKKVTSLDEIEQRRASRLAAAGDPVSAEEPKGKQRKRSG